VQKRKEFESASFMRFKVFEFIQRISRKFQKLDLTEFEKEELEDYKKMELLQGFNKIVKICD